MDNIPQDHEAERAVLSTLCAPGADHLASQWVPQLSQSDFVDPRHQIVFEALRTCLAGKIEINVISLNHTIKQAGKAHLVGDFSGLHDLLHGTEVSDPSHLVSILHNKRRCRQLMHLGQTIIRSASDVAADGITVANESQHQLKAISAGGSKYESRTAMDILLKMAHGEPLRGAGNAVGGKWGDATLDSCVPIPRGEYVSFGARPGVGKSSIMVQSAVSSAMVGLTVLCVSLEMAKYKIEARIAAHICGVSFSDLAAGRYDASHVNELGEHTAALQRIRYLDPPAHTPWSQIEALIRYEVESNGVDFVLIDQFDKIGRGEVKQGSTEAYAFGRVSEGIMGLAKELDIGMLVLVQLKNEDGAIPTLGSHADSDRPGKDAALVVHLYRDRAEKHWAKVQKNRNGAWVEKVWPVEVDGGLQRIKVCDRSTETAPQMRL